MVDPCTLIGKWLNTNEKGNPVVYLVQSRFCHSVDPWLEAIFFSLSDAYDHALKLLADHPLEPKDAVFVEPRVVS